MAATTSRSGGLHQLADGNGVAAAKPPGGTFRALRHPNFRLFLFGQALSLVGTWMQSVAQSWLIYRLTHSELLTGTIWFCLQAPVLFLGPLGGLVSDRRDRKRVVILTQVLSLLQAVALAVLTISGAIAVWHLMALALVLGAINAFDMPARQALIAEITSKEDLLSAISLNSAVFNAARVVGPGIAGLFVARFGEGPCFLLNAVSFVAVIFCLVAMRVAPVDRQPAGSPLEHLRDGFRYVRTHPQLKTVLSLLAMTTVAGMPGLVLMPFFADGIFHRGSAGQGFLMAAMGCGAVIGTLALAGRTQIQHLARVMFWSALLLGVSLASFAWSPSFFISLALMPAIGFNVFRGMASANTMIQTLVPDSYRGRTMALYSMTVVGLGPVGGLGAGSLAHALGARNTVMAGAVLAIVSALWFHRASGKVFS